jgi:hypothetical protein
MLHNDNKYEHSYIIKKLIFKPHQTLTYNQSKSINMTSALDYGITKDLKFTTYDDDNFFGADVDYIVEEEGLRLDDDHILNPFYVGRNNTQVESMSDFDLFSKYKQAIAICMKNGCTTPAINLTPIYQKIISKQDYDELQQHFTLIQVSIKLLKNKCHRKTSLLIDRPLLQHLNSQNLNIESIELVVPLFDLKEKVGLIYSQLYESEHSIDILETFNSLYKYYECNNYKNIILDRFSKLCGQLKESDYWANPYHCAINMSDKFKERTFKLKEATDPNLKAAISGKQTGIQDKNAREVISKITAGKDDYQNIYRKSIFTDVTTALQSKNSKYKLYKIDHELPNMTKDQVSDLFNSVIDNKMLFTMFNTFLLSKRHCHLVLNNDSVLTKMQPFFQNKFVAFYNYIMAYPWTCMYFEECIKKTRTINSDRYVFPINTASKLPFFPYCDDIHMNAYCVLPVNKKDLNSKENCHGMAMISGYKSYGIDNLDGFVTKSNIFTSQQSDKSIFDGLPTFPNSKKWKNYAISGSIIPACAQKRNPLVDQVTHPDMSYPDQMASFFNQYYGESDIDMMCNAKSVFGFIDCVSELVSVINKNLVKFYGNNAANTIELEPIKSVGIIINIKYIEDFMKSFGTSDEIIANIASPSIKENLYGEYLKNKMAKNIKHRESMKGNSLYEHFYKFVSIDEINVMITSYEVTKASQYETDSDTYIYLNDLLSKDEQVPDDKNILLLKISENIKFKIRSERIPHSLEIFRTKFEDYFSCVSRFHLPCVRGYYDGENVYLLPSCVTALMTFTNIDYKYFAGIRDPIDIINKYRMRGFGTMINQKEKGYLIEYNGSVNKWKGMITVDPKNSQSIANHFGYRKYGDNIFKPLKYTQGHPDESYRKPDCKYVNDTNEYYEHYKTAYGYIPGQIDLLKCKAFKEDGSIEPFKKWVAEAAYEELSK